MAKEETNNKNLNENAKQKTEEMLFPTQEQKRNYFKKADSSVNYKYKDTLFRFIFNDKEKLLRLYNALNHSNYENPEDLEINTLENVVYLSMKNDLSFLFDCPNIPLRDLHYVSTLLEGMIPRKYTYSSKLIKIPTPHFVVFYNGEKEMEDRSVLKLSDAFEQKEEHPQLELVVTVININYGRNTELMEACKDIKDYSIYVQKVRNYSKTMEIEKAVAKAVKECIEDGILVEILTKFRAEVEMISITEYDKQLHEQTLLEDGREEGREEGIEMGEMKNLLKLIQKKLSKGKSYVVISEELETDLDVVEQICEVINSANKNSTQEEILKILMEKKIELED